MMENLHRDEVTMPTVRHHLTPFREYQTGAREALLRGRHVRGRARERVRAAIGHALAYPTWRSLTREQGLDDAQAAELMGGLVAGAGGS
jgi:hypothetical protein